MRKFVLVVLAGLALGLSGCGEDHVNLRALCEGREGVSELIRMGGSKAATGPDLIVCGNGSIREMP